MKKTPSPIASGGALPVYDEGLVVAALALTEPSITTEDAAAGLFFDVARRRSEWKWPMSAESKKIPPFVTADWQLAQVQMRAWLPKIAVFGDMSAKDSIALLRDIAEKSESWGHTLRMQLGLGGTLQWTVETDTIANVCARACMVFIMPAGWNARLGHCQYDKCGKWFLRPEPKRGSVPLYCSKQHANNARVSAFRERQQSET